MDLASKKCLPCEDGVKPFSKQEAEKYLAQVKDWSLSDDGLKIKKQFKFKTYLAGIDFVNKVAQIAEEKNHHPNMSVGYQKITVISTTHAIGGLSENDFIIAAKIDKF